MEAAILSGRATAKEIPRGALITYSSCMQLAQFVTRL
jgi:hypothetical protein